MSKYPQHLDRLEDVPAIGLSRRGFMRLLGRAPGATVLGSVLAACGQQPAPAASAKPAEPAKPAEAAKPAAPAAAATTAPASGRRGQTESKPAAVGPAEWRPDQRPLDQARHPQPALLHGRLEQGVERLMFGALVRVNDKLEAIPDLAEKIDVSPDAKTYTFTLKKGITFTDGKPLTSQDVKFTYERAVDKRPGSWRGRLLDIQGATEYGDQQAPTISGLETPDDHTVKMTLRKPDLDLAADDRRLLGAEHPAGPRPQGRRATSSRSTCSR